MSESAHQEQKALLLARAFPFHLALDRNLRIIGCGPALGRLLPELAAAPPLQRAFVLLQPRTAADFGSLRRRRDCIVLLRARKRPTLRLCGGLLFDDNDERLLFLGSPRLGRSEDLAALSLLLGDSVLHDARADEVRTLRAARDELELDLEQRAAELVLTNSALQREIFEHRQTQTDLRTALEEIRTLADAAFDAHIALDGNGRVLAWNAAAERMFGWRRDEVVGRDLAELIVPPRFRDSYRAALAHRLRNGAAASPCLRRRMPAMRRDGSEFPAELAQWSSREGLRHHAFVHDLGERRGEAHAREPAQSEEEAPLPGSIAPAAGLGMPRGTAGDDSANERTRLSEYLRTLRQQALLLREAATAGDTRVVGDIACNLEASSRAIGAQALGDLCAELQNAGRAADRAAIAARLQRFVAAVARVGASIEERIDRPGIPHGVR